MTASRFREYLPPALSDEPGNVTRKSEPFTVEVPSSARPEAPRIAQVLPTFSWERERPEGIGVVTTRRGGGFRVYLERPWFTSGEGELLGVVLSRAGTAVPAPPFVTRWGRDPIWSRFLSLPTTPRLDHVVAPAASTSSATLADQGGAAVAVAGYPVAWDEDRGLWSCDLGLSLPQSYTPFVRLALVRWQPHSLPGLELSPVVLADLAQPAPDRTLTIIRGFDDTPAVLEPGDLPPLNLGVRLVLDGPGPPTRVDVTVQLRMAAGTGGEVGWADATDPGIHVQQTDPPAGSTARWSAVVSFTDVVPANDFRLLVRESEVFPDGRLRVLFLETVDV